MRYGGRLGARSFMLAAACVATSALAGSPAPLTHQRFATVIESVARDCDGATTPDPLFFDSMSIVGDRLGNRFVATGHNGPGVLAFTASGRLRWRFDRCLETPDPWMSQHWQIAGVDGRGGIWIRESRSHVVIDMQWSRLHHVDASGDLTASIDPREFTGYTDAGLGIVDGNLLLTWTEPLPPDAAQVLRRVEFDPDGTIVSRRDIARGDDQVVFGRLLATADGEERMLGRADVLLAPPATYGHDIVLSRVTPDNVAEHIVTLRGPFTTLVFDSDGTPWFTQYQQPRTLIRLMLDGNATTIRITPTLPAAYDRGGIYRGHEDRFLLVGDRRLALVDEDGQVQRDIAIDAMAAGHPTPTSFGWLLPITGADDDATAVVYAPDDLAERHRFSIDLPSLDGTATAQSTQPDIAAHGSLLMLDQRTDPDGITRTRVVGFAVPGSAAAARLLGDGFEP
ncbi:hypothetical protein [Chiayiivirga flava]|uniref:Uncharacterized protein n=1 Tax=Chiayiivirga flava TaxID=659595 RepID=A0A7W8G367_9GAMM|nr:hypothetical protein [Chiayiivirga flava]MBB5209435.1 hypothetical protein [Chiayiivirga flava]